MRHASGIFYGRHMQEEQFSIQKPTMLPKSETMQEKRACSRTSLLPLKYLGPFTIASVALLWENPILLSAELLALSTLRLMHRKSNAELKLFLFCGIGGAAAESFLVNFGIWKYAFPNALGIPLWLPILWGITGLCILGRYNQLDAAEKKSNTGTTPGANFHNGT